MTQEEMKKRAREWMAKQPYDNNEGWVERWLAEFASQVSEQREKELQSCQQQLLLAHDEMSDLVNKVAQARQQAIEECAKLRNALQLIADRDDCEALRYGRHGCECSSCIARESLTPPAAREEK